MTKLLSKAEVTAAEPLSSIVVEAWCDSDLCARLLRGGDEAIKLLKDDYGVEVDHGQLSDLLARISRNPAGPIPQGPSHRQADDHTAWLTQACESFDSFCETSMFTCSGGHC